MNKLLVLFVVMLSACGSPDRKTDTMGDGTSSHYSVAFAGGSSEPEDAGSDSSSDGSVDMAACHKDYDENCVPPCLELQSHSPERKSCLDNCVILYRRCTHCPTVDWLNQ
jgi:hypothetical protein